MKAVSGLAHVAIRVSDLDRSLAFYVGKLGFAEMMRIHYEDGRLMLVYLRITDTQFLEIFPDAETDRAPAAEANGLNHFCLQVDSLEAALADLAAQGVALMKPHKLGLDRNWQAWIEDPDGNRIELMEMAPNSLQAEAISRLRAADDLPMVGER